jgi:hypothetical protein
VNGGATVIYPKKWVALRIDRGSVYCKQKRNRKRWVFRGHNVRVDVSGTLFGIVVSRNAVVVKVAEGKVRVSARRLTRVVPAKFQVAVPNGRRPASVRRLITNAMDKKAFQALRLDVTTTQASDAEHVFGKSKRGAIIAENPIIGRDIEQRLSGIKPLLSFARDEFIADPYAAAKRIYDAGMHVAIVAGGLETMAPVFQVLRNDRNVRKVVGTDLDVTFVPLRSVSFDDLPSRTVVTTQYATHGVSFGHASDFGEPSPGPFDCGPPSVEPSSITPSTPNVAVLPYCNQTAPPYYYWGTFGRFSPPVLGLSARVQVVTTCDGPCVFGVSLVGYAPGGMTVAKASVDVSLGSWGRLSIAVPVGAAASIRTFAIYRDIQTQQERLIVDDLTFETPS